MTNRIKTIAYLEIKDRDDLNNISAKTGATISKIVERAVKQMLKKENK